MDRNDEFSKWIETIELALTGRLPEPTAGDSKNCNCGNWSCPVCYPEDSTIAKSINDEPQACTHCGHVHEKEECTNQEGNFSPMTYAMEGDLESKEEMIGAIDFMQDSGLSHSGNKVDTKDLYYSDEDTLSDTYKKVIGKVSENSIRLRPSLLEQISWDEELSEFIQDAELEESSLSRLIGKMNGGQKLVSWLHRRHRLDNEADLQPAGFSHRLFWTQFKADPDNFVIVSADNGVAAIKPYEKYIKTRAAEYAKKKKPYNPSRDNTIPYQIVAFTADGQQVDPELLKPESMDADDDAGYSDPTVTKARMGLHHGRDIQNPDNVFNLLAEQIGRLHTVWVTGAGETDDEESTVHQRAWSSGAVPRGKMSARADLKKGPHLPYEQAISTISAKLKPIASTLARQALQNLKKQIQQSLDNDQPDQARDLGAASAKLRDMLQNMSLGGASVDSQMRSTIEKSIEDLAQAKIGTPEYEEYAKELALGGSAQLKPLLDKLRNKLLNM